MVTQVPWVHSYPKQRYTAHSLSMATSAALVLVVPYPYDGVQVNDSTRLASKIISTCINNFLL